MISKPISINSLILVRITIVAEGLYITYYYFVTQKVFPMNNFDDITKMIMEGKPIRFGGMSQGLLSG
jgi:hypothetical protein